MLCNQRMELAVIACTDDARVGHINSSVSTEMDYCAAYGTLFNTKYDKWSLQRCAANVISFRR